MQNIKLHVINSKDTIYSICEKYSCTEEDIYLLNPLLRNKHLTSGNLIYILSSKNEEIVSYSFNKSEIYILSKNAYISYINNYNDYILNEVKLFKKYEEISSNIKNKNDALLLYDYLCLIHKHILLLIDDIKIESNSIENKKNLLDSLNLLISFLHKKSIKIDKEYIHKDINILFDIIYHIFNNNYYQIELLLNEKRDASKSTPNN